MHYVYGWKNKINNKWYIGITKRDYKTRWHEHEINALSSSKKSQEKLKKFYRAIRKYGLSNFEKHVLEIQNDNCSLKMLAQAERFWIKYYNSYSNGYNCDEGGNGYGYKQTEEVRNKMSQNRKGKLTGDDNPMRRPEVAKKNAEKRRGKKLTGQALQNIRDAHPKGFGSGENNPMWGRRGEDNPNYGRKWSAEEKAKHNLKRVMSINIQDGTIAIYESQADAERKTGVKQQNIGRAIRGNINQAGGYYWEEYN